MGFSYIGCMLLTKGLDRVFIDSIMMLLANFVGWIDNIYNQYVYFH